MIRHIWAALVIFCGLWPMAVMAERLFLALPADQAGLVQSLHDQHPTWALSASLGALGGALPPRDIVVPKGGQGALGVSFRRSDLTGIVLLPAPDEVGDIDAAVRFLDWAGTMVPKAALILLDPSQEQSWSAQVRARLPRRTFRVLPVTGDPLAVLAHMGAPLVIAAAPPPPPPPPQVAGHLPVALGQPSVAQPILAMGLNGISDWSTAMPFLDVMKSARPWIGHRAGQWGAFAPQDLEDLGLLDAAGWPKALPEGAESIESLIFTDVYDQAAGFAGRYRLTWEGKGDIRLSGRAQNADRQGQVIWFDYTPGQGGAGVQITRIDPADPIRNIQVVREDRIALLDLGVVFNPEWLVHIRDLRTIRFMDWMGTNGSTQSGWQDRPQPQDYTYQRRGVPVEVMVELANLIGADPWFTLPHLADDAYVAEFAQIVRATLSPKRKVYVEWSNEVWNFIFPQTQWALQQAKARWGREGDAWMQWAGLRAAEVMRIWTREFATQQDRLIRVAGMHTGWKGLEAAFLQAPLGQAEGHPAPVTAFDAYAVTGYFGHEVTDDSHRPQLMAALPEAAAFVTRTIRAGSLRHLTQDLWPYHADVARKNGLRLVMYEGGTHIVAHPPHVDDAKLTQFLTSYSYGSDIAGLYQDLMQAWGTLGGDAFNAFVEVAAPSKWGSWGQLRHLGDASPRMDVLRDWNVSGAMTLPVRDFDAAQWRQVSDGPQPIVMRDDPRDLLIAGASADVIHAHIGQRIDGGLGEDQVVLEGRAQDWQITQSGAVFEARHAKGSVWLRDIEQIDFRDGGRVDLAE